MHLVALTFNWVDFLKLRFLLNIINQKNWNNYPNRFRVVVVIFASFFLTIHSINNYLNISSPTDENIFADPPTRMYVNKAIKAIKKYEINGEYKLFDSLKPGDFIIEINNNQVRTDFELDKVLKGQPDESVLNFKVFSLKNREVNDYRIRRSEIDSSSILYLESAVIVEQVVAKGASEKAGILVGDIITSINGREFRNANQADRILRGLKAGQEFSYQVLRNGNFLDIKIVLARYGIPFALLFVVISGYVFMGVGLFFCLKRPRLIAARLSGMALFFLGFALSGAISYPAPAWYIYFTSIIITSSIYISIALFIHSFYYFPHEKKELLEHKWTVFLPYLIACLAIIWIFVRLFAGVTGKFLDFIPISFIVAFILFLLIINIKFKKHSTKEDKAASRVLLYALFINLFYITLSSILQTLGYMFNIFIYTGLITILIPIAYLYTVGRYRLLDLDLRLRKNIQYLIINILWKTFILGIFILTIWVLSNIDIPLPNLHFTGSSIIVLGKELRPELKEVYENYLNIMLAIAAALAYLKLYKKGIESLDRRYFRPKFDYRKAIAELNEALKHNIDMNSLIKEIVDKIGQIVLLKRAGIIIFQSEGRNPYARQFFNMDETIISNELESNCLIFKKSVEEIHGSFRVEYLEDPLKSIFTELQFQYLLPIKLKGKLLGAILLGDKLSEAPFTNIDLEFMQAIAEQTAVSVENTILYYGLAQQERIKHELALARKIQMASLPQVQPSIQGLDISGVSIPAFEVGGDFYDYLLNGDNTLTVVVGDVSGKGAYAALHMSKAQGIIRTLNEFHLDPKELCIKTNNLLYKSIEKSSFISVIAAKFDLNNKKIKLSRAGHLPLLAYRAKSKFVEEITPKGLVLGVADKSIFDLNLEEVEFTYSQGDIFLFATDGAVEASDDLSEFGIERIKNIIKNNSNLNSNQLQYLLIDEIKKHAHSSELADDMTIVVVKMI